MGHVYLRGAMAPIAAVRGCAADSNDDVTAQSKEREAGKRRAAPIYYETAAIRLGFTKVVDVSALFGRLVG